MRNFSTNQTRGFYTAVRNRTGETSMDNIGDVTLVTITPEENGAAEAIAFKYRNGHGKLTRTDTIGVNAIRSINCKEAAGTPLQMHTLTIDSSVFDISNKKLANNNDALGKTFITRIDISQLFDYNPSNSLGFVAGIVGDATNLGSASAFYKAMAVAIVNGVPAPDKDHPYIRVYGKKNDDSFTDEIKKGDAVGDISGTLKAIAIVAGPQKFVLGKLSGDPCPIALSTTVKIGEFDEYKWGSVAVAASIISGMTEIPGAQALAELEYFALGEKGDYERGYRYPNDYDHTPEYLINTSKSYKVMTIEYFLAGNAEDVQKSPRTLQIAAEISGTGSTATCILDGLYSAVLTAIGKGTSGSGSGA